MSAPRRPGIALASLALISLSCSLVHSGANAPAARFALCLERPSPTEAADQTVAAVEDFFAQPHTGLSRCEIAWVSRTVVVESRRAGFSPALVLAVIEVESGGGNSARSPAGALGLMQLRPATAEAVAARIGMRWRGPATLSDPVANVRLGVRYLEEMVGRFGNLSTALAAYNWGPTRIRERQRNGELIPAVYAQRVMGAYRETLSATGEPSRPSIQPGGDSGGQC